MRKLDEGKRYHEQKQQFLSVKKMVTLLSDCPNKWNNFEILHKDFSKRIKDFDKL